MDKFIGKKRNIEQKSLIENNNSNKMKIKSKENEIIESTNSNDMKELIDDCFNDFINGNTNKLYENYNLLKQKFYEIIQN